MNVEDMVYAALDSHERTRMDDARYVAGYEGDDNLFVEVGVNQRVDSPENVIKIFTALASHLAGECETVNIALVGNCLYRLTVGEDHSDMDNQELRQRVAHSLRSE